MAIVRAQVNMPRDTGLPEDVVVNTWHFLTAASPPLESTLEAIHTELINFYGAIDGVVLGSALGAEALVKYYDLSHAMPRAPIYDNVFTLTPAAGGIPAEVAICLSFQGAKASGQNQARRRGRVYLGPIAAAVVNEASGRTSVTTTARTAIRDAALALMVASQATALWEWAVYSPTDNAAIAVTNGWVDDAFDTVRGRGTDPTVRTTFGTV